jgi:hypothetical protein
VTGGLLPDRGRPTPTGHDPVELVEPGSRARTRARWELRAIQWRAAALAEVAFDGPVVARLLGGAGRGLRGLLELEVPFDGLPSHEAAEARFLASASVDEVLGGARLVVVFTPRVSPR